MLNTLRNSAHGFFAKLLLCLLVLSFGVWGIGDIFRQGGMAANVAIVGGTPITMQTYAQALHRRQDEMRQMLGKQYSPEMLKKLGIPQRRVLSELINDVLVDKETAALGLVAGDDAVIDSIEDNPQFANRDGHFDKAVYLETLKNMGMGEQRYVSLLRGELVAKLLVDTLTANAVVPDALVNALYKARDEQRVADMIIIPTSAAGIVPSPTDADIKSYYDAHSSEFLVPEYRTLSYVALSVPDIESKIAVPEEEITRTYSDRAQDFRKPEMRTIEQMVFADKASADKASKSLAEGKSFADVARSSILLNKGKLSLGAVSKQEIEGQQGGEEVFSLPAGGVTKPVQTPFGWHIFHVLKVEPPSTIPLEVARAGITKDLAAKGAQDSLYKLVGELEDALAGGSTLENAAQKAGQKVISVGPVAQNGMTPEGKKATLPAYDNFLSVAFATNEKDHSQAMQAADGSYFLVYVDTVQPEHPRPLAQVKDQIAAAWKKEKQHSMLADISKAVAADLQGGKKLADALASRQIVASAVSSGKLSRTSEKLTEGKLAGKNVPDGLRIELFQLKGGHSTHAYEMADGSYLIASLTQVIAAPAPDGSEGSKKSLKSIHDELAASMSNELVEEYLTYLRGKYSVSVNDSAAQAADAESGQ